LCGEDEEVIELKIKKKIIILVFALHSTAESMPEKNMEANLRQRNSKGKYYWPYHYQRKKCLVEV
jgi:hypothetical protein